MLAQQASNLKETAFKNASQIHRWFSAFRILLLQVWDMDHKQ